jgi:hypothetical protein
LNQFGVSLGGPLQSWSWFWRVDQEINETSLIFKRQADDAVFLDNPLRYFLCGGYNEVTNATPLEFSRAFNDGQHVRREPGFEPGAAGGISWH